MVTLVKLMQDEKGVKLEARISAMKLVAQTINKSGQFKAEIDKILEIMEKSEDMKLVVGAIEAIGQIADEKALSAMLKIGGEKAGVLLVDLVLGRGSHPNPAAPLAAPPSPRSPSSPQVPSSAGAPPVCPRCGAPMVARQARTGARAGQPFWGCSQYPGCRGTRPGLGDGDVGDGGDRGDRDRGRHKPGRHDR
jgi:hypothetical protein